MQQLSPHIPTIAFEFQKKMKELNDTFRSHYEAYCNRIPEEDEDEDYLFPEAVNEIIRNQLHNLYHYIVENYNKLPKNIRIEIKYYHPLGDDTDPQEILISTAIRYVYQFYLYQGFVIDPIEVKFGNNVIDNFLIGVD